MRPFPAAAVMKFLLDFFTKKSRVQGRALPPSAQDAAPARGKTQKHYMGGNHGI